VQHFVVLHVCHVPDFDLVVAMAWERRARGGPYYTRSHRLNRQVVREYVGAGPFAELAAAMDALKRCQREEKAAYWKEERERLERETAFLRELEHAAEGLARATLVAGGYRRRRGEWRMVRD
jgi:hypothetical protein